MCLKRMRKINDTRYFTVHFEFLNCSSVGREDTGRSPPGKPPAPGLQ